MTDTDRRGASPDDLQADLGRRLDAELRRTVRRGRELAERLLDSDAEPTAAEHRLAALDKLCRLPAGDVEAVDRLCAALLDPGDGRAQEAIVEMVRRLLDTPAAPPVTEAPPESPPDD